MRRTLTWPLAVIAAVVVSQSQAAPTADETAAAKSYVGDLKMGGCIEKLNKDMKERIDQIDAVAKDVAAVLRQQATLLVFTLQTVYEDELNVTFDHVNGTLKNAYTEAFETISELDGMIGKNLDTVAATEWDLGARMDLILPWASRHPVVKEIDPGLILPAVPGSLDSFTVTVSGINLDVRDANHKAQLLVGEQKIAGTQTNTQVTFPVMRSMFPKASKFGMVDFPIVLTLYKKTLRGLKPLPPLIFRTVILPETPGTIRIAPSGWDPPVVQTISGQLGQPYGHNIPGMDPLFSTAGDDNVPETLAIYSAPANYKLKTNTWNVDDSHKACCLVNSGEPGQRQFECARGQSDNRCTSTCRVEILDDRTVMGACQARNGASGLRASIWGKLYGQIIADNRTPVNLTDPSNDHTIDLAWLSDTTIPMSPNATAVEISIDYFNGRHISLDGSHEAVFEDVEVRFQDPNAHVTAKPKLGRYYSVFQ